MSGLVALFAHGGAPVDAALLQRMTALHRTTIEAEREVSLASLGDRLFITSDARIDARDGLCARLRDHGRDLRKTAGSHGSS